MKSSVTEPSGREKGCCHRHPKLPLWRWLYEIFKIRSMPNFPGIDITTLPRISQIDCLPQNRVDPDEFEQKRRANKIDEQKNQLMAQTAALKEQSYGRKRTDYTSGILPPISQISMGEGNSLRIEAPRKA
ncbi:hypothetical protein OS493_011580 [Desmophyllum pertusum]|uniref:Uncharacterized protein n=1 Tax=Desmophyllum pertusum TaxID=174260 RepID=A0A9W9YQL3_9CNID|nr:hypothetical protein OS493_011580 [Desmophyllum pertusum]